MDEALFIQAIVRKPIHAKFISSSQLITLYAFRVLFSRLTSRVLCQWQLYAPSQATLSLNHLFRSPRLQSFHPRYIHHAARAPSLCASSLLYRPTTAPKLPISFLQLNLNPLHNVTTLGYGVPLNSYPLGNTLTGHVMTCALAPALKTKWKWPGRSRSRQNWYMLRFGLAEV